ncbi:MAG: preprotein translocase subunit YajC [Candidatus Omnitrophica bacterium]|nr:preprotein translocase subunit YajC [Candidatus Omnitrophota bacterium]
MPIQSAAAPGPLAMLLPFAVMFLIFYLLVFRPQSTARKDHERMIKSLKKNDEVVTSGGLYGTVVNVKPETLTLRIDDTVRVEVESSAIVRLVKPKAQGSGSTTPERSVS